MSTKVFANGFDLDCKGPFKYQGFFDDLASHSHIEFEHYGLTRVLKVEKVDSFYCGLLLTNTEQSKIITHQKNDDGSITVKVETLDGRPRSDFNFLALHADSGRGLLTSYRGSGGMTAVSNMLNKHYRAKVLRIAADLRSVAAIEDDRDRKKRLQQHAKHFANSKFALDALPKDANFYQDLERLTGVTSFWFKKPAETGYFSAEAPYLEYERHFLKFDKERTIVAKATSWLMGFVRDNPDIIDGKVEGFVQGEPFDVPITPERWCFDKYEFDDVAIEHNFKLNDLYSTPIMTMLTDIIRGERVLHDPVISGRANGPDTTL